MASRAGDISNAAGSLWRLFVGAAAVGFPVIAGMALFASNTNTDKLVSLPLLVAGYTAVRDASSAAVVAEGHLRIRNFLFRRRTVDWIRVKEAQTYSIGRGLLVGAAVFLDSGERCRLRATERFGTKKGRSTVERVVDGLRTRIL
jgi:hypothetical protein